MALLTRLLTPGLTGHWSGKRGIEGDERPKCSRCFAFGRCADNSWFLVLNCKEALNEDCGGQTAGQDDKGEGKGCDLGQVPQRRAGPDFMAGLQPLVHLPIYLPNPAACV